jgi:transposase InsO family protein
VKALNIKVSYLRSNNGSEYTSKNFERYCKDDGITRHLTTIYTLEQDVVAEQLNTRTMLEKHKVY